MPRWENGFQTSEEIQRFKRYAVIREAARIMSRRGFHNTSLDEVAKVLGISKGTLYNYVTDKQEILFECHNIALDLGNYAAEVAARVGGKGIDRVRILLRCYIIWMYGQPGVGGVTFDVNALRDDDRAVVIQRRDAMERNLVSLLDESLADGSIRQCDTRVAVYGMLSAINGMSLWFSPDGRLTIDHVANELLDLLTLSLSTAPDKLAPYPEIPAYPTPETALGMFSRSSAAVVRQDKPMELAAKSPTPRARAAGAPARKPRSSRAKA